MSLTEKATFILKVQEAAAFRAFSAALGARIAAGRASEALAMVRDVGAPAKGAWEVVDGWPIPEDFGRLEEDALYGNSAAKAAVRLAHFFPNFDRHDWEALLARSIRIFEAGKASGSGGPNAEG